MTPDPSKLDWAKGGGLIPAVVQHSETLDVLMVGYMNEEALRATVATGRVTFFSRSRGTLWVKGETSGHFLELVSMAADCDADALLVAAIPRGPVCHLGTRTCFGDREPSAVGFLDQLDRLIGERERTRPAGSYTTTLFEAGIDRIAQKVGEEAVEVVIASKNDDARALAGEAADLVYHLTVLLRASGLSLDEVARLLRTRHASKRSQ